MSNSVIASLRRKYHEKLCQTILGYRVVKGDPTDCMTFADKDSGPSVRIAAGIAEELEASGHTVCSRPKYVAQTAGKVFGEITKDFLRDSCKTLLHLRPGEWEFSDSQQTSGITRFVQYNHIADLANLLNNNPELKAALGGDYLITPDIVVCRRSVPDSEINRELFIVDSSEEFAQNTPLRSENYEPPAVMLHASISCKWTMRSDRAQNTRTEALNLVRNRKGPNPHIVAVTFEPLAGIIASIALGTGDIDCTYHGALPELLRSTSKHGSEDQLELLNTMVDGKRLRDISDLPFDLSM